MCTFGVASQSSVYRYHQIAAISLAIHPVHKQEHNVYLEHTYMWVGFLSNSAGLQNAQERESREEEE
jgi:hypothetical protein